MRFKPTRTGRYTSAEHNLTESFRNCQNQTRSTSELQVEALKNAISFINTQVNDSKEQTEKLRQLLKDRVTIEPEAYREMQRRRWMEERRHQATESLSKVLQQYLTSSLDSPLTSQELKPTYAPSSTSKANANLVKFFECSPSRQRRPIRNRTRRRTSLSKKAKHTQENTDDTPTSRPHGIIPLVLKVPKPVPPFLHDCSRAPEEGNSRQASVTPSLSPASPPIGRADLSFISEIPESVISTASSPFSSASVKTLFSNTESVGPLSHHGNGTAIIWRDSPCPRDDSNRLNEILDDLVISMPDYAVNLLAGFDSKPPSQSLSLNIDTLSPLLSPVSTSASKSASFTPDTPRSKSNASNFHHTPKSPSRKRISALFSVPEALSSRKGLGLGPNSHPHCQHTTHINKSSAAPVLPDITLMHDDSESLDVFLSPPIRPVSVSFSSTLSIDKQESAATTTNPVSVDEGKARLASRLRNRVSGLLRHWPEHDYLAFIETSRTSTFILWFFDLSRRYLALSVCFCMLSCLYIIYGSPLLANSFFAL